MVLDALHLRRGDFGGANVHPLVDLHGVAGENLAAQRLGQADGQAGFSRGRRPDDTNDFFHE